MTIAQEHISSFSLTEDGTTITLIDPDGNTLKDPNGNPMNAPITDYSVVSAIGGRYDIHSGVYTDFNGNSYDFTASTDPVDKIVIIIAIFTLGCRLAIGLAGLIDDCKNRMSDNIKECANAGGLPSLKAEVNFAPPEMQTGISDSVARMFAP